jgi:hypothetical protein
VLPDDGARYDVAARVEASGGTVEEQDGDPVVRDPSGNALVLALA